MKCTSNIFFRINWRSETRNVNSDTRYDGQRNMVAPVLVCDDIVGRKKANPTRFSRVDGRLLYKYKPTVQLSIITNTHSSVTP